MADAVSDRPEIIVWMVYTAKYKERRQMGSIYCPILPKRAMRQRSWLLRTLLVSIDEFRLFSAKLLGLMLKPALISTSNAT